MLPLEDLENIDKAAEIVNHAIEYNYKIALLFDTDSDGVSSGTIIYRYLEMYGADVFMDTIDESLIDSVDIVHNYSKIFIPILQRVIN